MDGLPRPRIWGERSYHGVMLPRAGWVVVAALLYAAACGSRSELVGPPGSGGAVSSSAATTASSSAASSVAQSAVSSVAVSVSSAVSSSVSSVASSASSSSVASSSSGSGGAPATGCSDGTREGFVDEMLYPAIAGCSGGWTVPGILVSKPTCARLAGNSSANPKGTGCSTEDLCAAGFHVCAGAVEVAQKSPTGCKGAALAGALFFATRQGSTGCAICTLGQNSDPAACNGCNCAMGCAPNPTTANDVFGCGTLGQAPLAACGTLDRFSNDLCGALGAPWSCGNDGCNEANAVTKPAPDGGGVLCCAD
jgi:hypothetical protein